MANKKLFEEYNKKKWRNLDRKHFKYDIHPWVFSISAIIILSGVIFTLIAGDYAENLFATMQSYISEYTGWFFVLVMNIVLIFCIYLLTSPLAKLRIGGKNAKPEFSNISWFAMLFSAGMGIGLLFYGVAEPITHFLTSPLASNESANAAREAMTLTFLHWGLHPWAVYALVGLGLAFFGYNNNLPLSIRNIFYPILGDKIYGWQGSLIDILATVSCLFGVATSLGFGVQQVNAGLNYLFDIPISPQVQILLITGITAIATWSVVKGLDKGIRLLSEINIGFALILMIFVLLLGPTLFILNGFVQNLGNYIGNFFQLATWTETYSGGSWQDGWTIFYWAWWIAWSPFVGMFIARISFGRTVKEFLAGVLIVPVLVTFLWMTVFGDSAIFLEFFQGANIGQAVSENISTALFKFLSHFPLSSITSFLSVIVIISFFVTSSDSGSMVIDIITSGGNQDPPIPQRLFWAITEGVVAAVLLVGGGLTALQTSTIITGLPFGIILILMCFSVYKGLSNEYNNEMGITPFPKKKTFTIQSFNYVKDKSKRNS